MTRILVVGAGGFIGSHLSTFLAAKHEVFTCSLSGQGTARHRVLDPDAPDFVGILSELRPDICINCSGAANVSASFLSPLRDFDLNVARVVQLLDAIRTSGVDTRFMHLSSAAIYGNPAVQPVAESALAAPLSPYGHHKRLAELACAEYTRLFSVPTLSLRIFSAYGPRLRKQIFWDIFQKWKANGHVELFGTGAESRDFIFIADLCRAIQCLLEAGTFDGRGVNVGSGRSVTIRDSAALLLANLSPTAEVHFSGNERKGDPEQWCADIVQLRSCGFEPEYDISAGLKETAQWLKEQA